MNKRLTFLDHLEELRKRLLVVLAAVGIFSLAAWFFSNSLLDFLTRPLIRFNETPLYFNAPYDAFLAHLKVSLLAGALLASPVFFIELWQFIVPGLYRRERTVFLPLVIASVVLFLTGAAFAFWGIVPVGLRFLLGFQTASLKPLLGVDAYFSFLVGMVLAAGILFDLPVVVLGLVRGGVLGPGALRSARKGVIVFIFILAAVLTPSPDVFSQILLAIPLLILFEASVFLAKRIEKKETGD